MPARVRASNTPSRERRARREPDGTPRPGTAPTVWVVDDDADIRSSIALLMRSVRLAASTFAGADEFLSAWRPGDPGCLVLDVRMPGMSGLELQALLKERGAEVPIVFLSGHGDIPMALRAVRNGALDFLEKPFRGQALIDAVHAALAADAAHRAARGERETLRALVGSMSPREAQVADLVVDGLSSPEIARKLKLSPRTVEMHRARAMRRLGVDNVAELARVILAARALAGPPASPPSSTPARRDPKRAARG
jgi:FixJ family two-component response regulator